MIIPTYNRKQFIADAIDSCLAQTYPNIEVIIVDDGSTDDTEVFLRNRYGGQIRYIYQENQGPGIARNTGIDAARGDLIHFCDTDDQLLPEKVEVGVDYLLKHPDISVIHTAYQMVAIDGETPIDTPPFPEFTDNLFCEILKLTGNHILISSTLVWKAALEDVGGFPHDTEFRSAEDWDLFLRLAMKYKFHGIPERLVLKRSHGSNMLSKDNYYGALGRLKTIQRARNYQWQACMLGTDFDRIEAARFHMYALALWKRGQRKEAREAFLQAVDIYPPFALQRRIYALYTYILPPQSVQWTVQGVQSVKRLLKSARQSLKSAR